MQTIDVSLGIDISKATVHAAVLKDDKRAMVKEFSNDDAGFAQLSEWLKLQGIERVHGCMEATSIYGHALATYLHTQGHRVSIVNPALIKAAILNSKIKRNQQFEQAGNQRA